LLVKVNPGCLGKILTFKCIGNYIHFSQYKSTSEIDDPVKYGLHCLKRAELQECGTKCWLIWDEMPVNIINILFLALIKESNGMK
jgi:hypothetical protein